MNDLENNHSDFVELDPSGRYGRYNEILGKGAAKTVYRAFDQYEGIEVAWNKVKLFNFLQNPKELERLYCEIHLLKTLKHRNIMKLYASWVDTSKRNINFVTEMFTSGTLREYRHKHKKVDMRAVKNWCRQILMGLLYLHSHNPPVIHRDLKCDNIFVNGNHGEIKIGDLGLASVLRKSQEAHCVGTPEFMAPEVYAEEYNELADIYSFGMCILEMVTFEYPYSECTNSAQIYKKVTSGKKPDALNKVEDQEVRQFIEKCLVNASVRLSARELLSDPFLQVEDCESNVVAIECQKELEHAFPDPSRIQDGSSYQLAIDENERDGIDLFEHEEHLPQVDITIKGKKKSDGSIFLRLRISDKDDHIRNIYFPFDVENDTALSVATEMVGELDITDQDVTKIAEMIDGEIVTLVPDWTTGPGFEDGPDFTNLCHNCASTHTSIGSYKQMMNCCEEACGAMHGRFEEYIYNVDNHLGDPNSSIQSEGSNGEDWDQQRSVECSEIDSGDGHFAREHEHLSEAKNLTQSLSAGDTSSSSYDISVDYESEINNAMRFLKAV